MKKIVYLVLVFLIACGKDDPKVPEPVLLEFPAQNTACTTGVEVTTTTSRVDFRWKASANTDVYEIEITDLISNSTQKAATSSTTLGVIIQKGRPYSWRVFSSNNETEETATSQSWLFYNAGSETTYAPFPAQVSAPISGSTVKLENGQVVLSWMGADVDSDIDSFEVILDTSNPPVVSQATLEFDEQELGITLDPATVYFWKILTTDREGNQSDSGVFSFRTQ